METIKNKQYVPFEATHVGELIKDELSARGMKQSDLSLLTGIQRSVLCDIIKGKRGITPEMSLLLEKVFNMPAYIFMNAQTNYELDCARISERVKVQTRAMEIWRIITTYVSVIHFEKIGLLGKDILKNIDTIFSIFQVKTIDELVSIYSCEKGCSYFKKSEKLKTNPINLFSWKYYCYYLSKKDTLNILFDRKNMDNIKEELNKVFLANVRTCEKIKEVLNKYGVKFYIVEKFDQTPVDGFSFWYDENPTIVVTLRKKNIDNLAFALFHEIGHLAKHIDRANNVGRIDIANEEYIDPIEEEANEFARNSFISDKEWKNFRLKKISPYQVHINIKELAEKLNINPQILFGRYQYETGFYKLKSKFETSIN